MELNIKSGKFWVLENKGSEQDIERFIYDDIRFAIIRLKQMIVSVDASNITLSTVDIVGKEWKIVAVSWAEVAMGIAREGIDVES